MFGIYINPKFIRRLKLPLYLALFFCLSLLLSGCDKTITITGKVTNSSTQTAVAGALVELYQGTTKKAQTTTDASGNYKISATLPTAAYTFKISATNYTFSSSSANLTTGASYTMNFLLTPVQPAPVQITAITPNDATMFNESDRIPLQAVAIGASIQYQFSIDGVVRQAWSTQATYNWQTSSSNVGKHTIKIEAKNAVNAVSRSAEIYILRKPVLPS